MYAGLSLATIAGLSICACDGALDAVAAQAVGERLAERLVEVRALDALRAGAREHVAGAALLGEGALARDEVGLVLLDAAAGRERGRAPLRRALRRSVSSDPRRALYANRPTDVQVVAARPPRRRSRRSPRPPRRSAPGRSRRAPRASAPRTSSGACSQATTRSASSRHRVALERERQPRHAPRLGHGLGELGADLLQAGVRGADRQDAAGGRLGGDHAERLGERARHDLRLAGGQQVDELGVLEPPDDDEPLGQRLRRLEVRASSTVSRNACRKRSGARGPPSTSRPASASSRARRRGRRRRARRRAARSPRGTRRSRRRRAARRAPAASTSGHAAASRSTPLETMSLPTYATRRSSPGRSALERVGGRAAGRARTPSPRARPRARRCAAAAARRSTPGRGLLGRARRERLDVDAGRAEARAVRAAPGRPSPPTGSPPCAASPTSTPPAPSQPLARPGQEALGVALDDVLERAAVDLHRVRDAERLERAAHDRRAHHEVVGQRDVGARRARRPRGPRRRCARRTPRAPRRCTRGTSSRRSPRSGRGRRPAAAGRCRAGRR